MDANLINLTKSFEAHKIDDSETAKMIGSRLLQIELALGKQTEILSNTVEAMANFGLQNSKNIDNLNSYVFGDHTNGGKGVSTRLETLEDFHKNSKWTVRTVWAFVIGTIIKFCFDLARQQK